jgi:hypothetical protein
MYKIVYKDGIITGDWITGHLLLHDLDYVINKYKIDNINNILVIGYKMVFTIKRFDGQYELWYHSKDFVFS